MGLKLTLRVPEHQHGLEAEPVHFVIQFPFPCMENVLWHKPKVYQRPDAFPATAASANGSVSRALRRGCCDKRLSGCWFASYKHFLLHLLTASSRQLHSTSGQVHSSKANLFIILKMSKCCLYCCSLFPALIAGHKTHKGTYNCESAETMEHGRCSWHGETARNTQEEPKICTYRITSCLREDTLISSLGRCVLCFKTTQHRHGLL